MLAVENFNPDALITTAEAAKLAGVDPVTIRVWTVRGYVSVAQTSEGRSYYRLGDIAAAEQIVRARRGPKRRHA